MKKVTIIIPDRYDTVLSVVMIGSYGNVTNVTQKLVDLTSVKSWQLTHQELVVDCREDVKKE